MPRPVYQSVGTGLTETSFKWEYGGILADIGVILQDLDKKQQSAVKSQIRRAVRDLGQDLTTQIKANASWSTRIPNTVKMSVTFGPKTAGASVVAGGKNAPHARALEMGNKNVYPIPMRAKKGEHLGYGTSRIAPAGRGLRHPVFARKDKTRDEWAWTEMSTRPFFFKAVQQRDLYFTARMNLMLEQITKEIGFTGN
jgi:hypothetical protein